MATGKNHMGIFKKILLEFIAQENPILVLLEWPVYQIMQIEAEDKLGIRMGSSAKRDTHIFQGVESGEWISG